MGSKIVSHRDLEVYQKAMEAAVTLFRASKGFPREETYSVTDQVRRSSRSVCANLAEAWRKRRYESAYICKLTDCEGEAAETQVWIEFAVKCGYLDRDLAATLYTSYDEILRMLVAMVKRPECWVIMRE
jgi:four helix bundle protein